MKKLNSVGFTLIELLAVITIMGILLMVAVPSVSRTIENSRRDTFADNALKYVDTVRTSVLADEIQCESDLNDDNTVDADKVTASGTPDGTYFFRLNTQSSGTGYQQTVDIMEKVAKSSWGSNDVVGYVKWIKLTDNTTKRTKTSYYVYLVDTAGHGFSAETAETQVSRSSIVGTGAANPADAAFTGDKPAGDVATNVFECTLK